jgi:chromosome segregation ATPase
MQDDVDIALTETERHRAASAQLSRQYKSHVGLKRELDAQARSLQQRLDRFVRYSAEESHRVASGLTEVGRELQHLYSSVQGMRDACANAERLCQDAQLKRDHLRNSLREIRSETSGLAKGLEDYMLRTQQNAAPLEARLRAAQQTLDALREDRVHLERPVHS